MPTVSGTPISAQTAADKLTADFAGNAGLAGAIYSIATEYEEMKKYEKAESIYKNILKSFPDSNDMDNALSSQKHLVFLYASMGKYSQAQEAFDKLIKDFAGKPHLAMAIYDIALKYEELGRYGEAKNAYQKVVQMEPNSFRGQKAKIDIPKDDVLAYIDAGDSNSAMLAVEKMITDFSGQPYLAVAVSRTGEQYYKKALQIASKHKLSSANQIKDCFKNGAAIYEKVTKKLPESTALSKTSARLGELETATPKAWYSAAFCYQGMGSYEKSIECCQSLVNTYPDFSMNWSALSLIGRNYEDMAEQGLIPKAEAEPKIKAIYEQLVEGYPWCLEAENARQWLSRHNAK
jgi:tetratricopeptide (TPR) repeat protein